MTSLMNFVVASLKVSQPSFRSKLRKFSCAIPFQIALKRLKIGISGALDGPQHNVNTFNKMSLYGDGNQATEALEKVSAQVTCTLLSDDQCSQQLCQGSSLLPFPIVSTVSSGCKLQQLLAPQCLQLTLVRSATCHFHHLKPV